jgi:hypothetical protein
MDNDDITGVLVQYDEPDWQPLYDIVGTELADWFMWMHEVELEDGVRVHAYKHIATRCYFHMATDGRALLYLPGGIYRELDRRRAIDLVFEGWDELQPAPDNMAAVRTQLRRARRRAAVRQASRVSQADMNGDHVNGR